MSYKVLDILESWRAKSDHLSVSEDASLMIEGCSARELVEEYGSPLYVMSETTLRQNYRQVKTAFDAVWPGTVNVMYAIKSNPNIALRSILSEEGAGGDCFSIGEIEATFRGGANPEKVAVNGSYKSDEVIERSVELGLILNLDAEEEVDNVERVARRLGKVARIAIRLKVLDKKYFKSFRPDCFVTPNFSGFMERSKWGETENAAERIIHKVMASKSMEMVGYHNHLGRASRDPSMWQALQGAFAEMVVSLYQKTGFSPFMVDIGGGWSRERDPESSSGDIRNPHKIEDYAHVVSEVMLRIFRGGKMPLPQLWLEPGRYIVGNSGVFLTRTVLVKQDEELGFTWVNVDSSTNNLLQIDLYDYDYVVLPAEHMQRPITRKADVVGIICVPSVFAEDCPLPDVKAGEIMAILDAGMYAEAKGNQFNSIPRPATILVKAESHCLIRRRETVEDVFSTMIMPERLKPEIV